MERTIPIDPILEKGYNVRLLVDDFDGLINTWFHRSVKFRSTVDTSINCQYDQGDKNKLDILPPFQRAWSFVYENESSGVILHADPSQFNVNIWISSDESVKDKLVNGLSIYEIVPPPDWGRKDWNRNEEKAQSYIDSHHVKPININYKSNRIKPLFI